MRRLQKVVRPVTGNRHTAAMLGLAMLAAGCFGSDLPGDTGTLSGKVTYKGRPIPAKSMVVFQHSQQGIPAWGETAADGSFSLQMRKEKRILVGEYCVGVMPEFTEELTLEQKRAMASGQAIPERPCPEIPKKYRNPEKSGVTFTVKPGHNTFELDMEY